LLLVKSSGRGGNFKDTLFENDEVVDSATKEVQTPNLFVHSKLDSIMLRQILHNPYRLFTGSLSGILTTIFAKCSYLFSYKTKMLYLQLVSSTTVDVHRSLYNIKQYFTKTKKVIEDRTLADIIARSMSRGGGGSTELVRK
jgi:hypothetical protein